jgi:hypothetical protein
MPSNFSTATTFGHAIGLVQQEARLSFRANYISTRNSSRPSEPAYCLPLPARSAHDAFGNSVGITTLITVEIDAGGFFEKVPRRTIATRDVSRPEAAGRLATTTNDENVPLPGLVTRCTSSKRGKRGSQQLEHNDVRQM